MMNDSTKNPSRFSNQDFRHIEIGRKYCYLQFGMEGNLQQKRKKKRKTNRENYYLQIKDREWSNDVK